MAASRRPRIGKPGRAYVGTSGWTYDDWAQTFYAGVPRRRWLDHYASIFSAVEVNASFYHSLAPSTYANWRTATPPAFRFSIKGSRFITHVHKLHDPAEPIARQRDAARELGDKLAVVLWQLPAGLHRHDDLLDGFLDALTAWPETRHAIEFRHDSWFADEVARRLSRHAVANVLSDAGDWPMWDAVTTDLVYVRLHGNPVTYHSKYPARALERWATRTRAWVGERRDVHVYFDNTDSGHAFTDAGRLAGLLASSTSRRSAS